MNTRKFYSTNWQYHRPNISPLTYLLLITAQHCNCCTCEYWPFAQWHMQSLSRSNGSLYMWVICLGRVYTLKVVHYCLLIKYPPAFISLGLYFHCCKMWLLTLNEKFQALLAATDVHLYMHIKDTVPHQQLPSHSICCKCHQFNLYSYLWEPAIPAPSTFVTHYFNPHFSHK